MLDPTIVLPPDYLTTTVLSLALELTRTHRDHPGLFQGLVQPPPIGDKHWNKDSLDRRGMRMRANGRSHIHAYVVNEVGVPYTQDQ